MPYNSAVPIRAFPSRMALEKVVHELQEDPVEDVMAVMDHLSQTLNSQAAQLLSSTPPPTSDKPLASSPLLPDNHAQPVATTTQPQVDATNDDNSNVSTDSRPEYDSLIPNHFPREIKKLVGPWNLGITLGEGATGRVRKARHVKTGQVAAVKIMSKMEAVGMRSHSVMQMDSQLASRSRQANRNALPFGLEREIVVMKLIDHPNITKLYDLWENRGEIYLVLEYVDGGELFNYIVDRGCIEEADAIRIFRQIISAVSYCHMFRVCHRDIKPENILVDRIGNIKLADFGMASREHIGGLNTSCGSPHYAPPEIACGEPYVGSRVDMWSCGVVLYVMLMGALPFGKDVDLHDIDGVLSSIISEEPLYNEKLTPLAKDLLTRLLHKDPLQRITSEEIWNHTLIHLYGQMAKVVPDPHRWIGGPPKPLTTKDCGRTLRRSDIDLDVVSGLCTLWHCLEPEDMMDRLMDNKPNYEKVIYRNLVKFKSDQEYAYFSGSLVHADSDVHHLQPRPNRNQSSADLHRSRKRPSSVPSTVSLQPSKRSMVSRTSFAGSATRADLLGPTGRAPSVDPYTSLALSSSSKFTIAAPPSRRNASRYSVISQPSRSSRRPSQKSQSTEGSYDPFRASSTGILATAAANAKITVLGDSSMTSRYGYANYAASLRHPAVDRMHSEGSSAVNSVRSGRQDHAGNKRSLRQSAMKREISSSSWASTRISSSSVRQFSVPSLRRKRGRQMLHVEKRPPPPARPRNPTPTAMRERYSHDVHRNSEESSSPAQLTVMKRQPPPVQEEIKTPLIQLTRAAPDNSNRVSGLWEERTRLASLELSVLMDEVFSETKIDTALWDDKTEKTKQDKELVRRSFDLPGLRDTGYLRPLPDVSSNEPEAPPLSTDVLNLRAMYEIDSREELTYVRSILTSRATGENAAVLSPLIEHVERLIQAAPPSRRHASAPEPNRKVEYVRSLSPVHEEDEPRHVSSPVKSKNGHFEKSSFRGNKSTIRLVNEEDGPLVPAPLKIRKKPSMPILSTIFSRGEDGGTQEKASSRSRLKFGASTSALNKMFNRDASKSDVPDELPKDSPDTVLIVSTTARSLPKRSSDDSKPKNWFRRSQVSVDKSHGPETVDDPARDEPVRSNTNTSSDEISFRLPKRESTTSRVIRFFKGQSKEKRMQIAIPYEDEEEWEDLPPQSSNSYGSARARNASRTTVNSATSRFTNTMTSRQGNRRNSSFARLSSPHLFNASSTHEPYPSASGATNLFARLFNFHARQPAPVPQLYCLHLSRAAAINEIRSILRDWRRYGLCHVQVNGKAGTVRASVAEDNDLRMLPVSLVATVHAVAVDGNAGGLSIVRVTSEWGNRNSFVRACEALNNVLRGRGVLIRDRSVAKEMKKALRAWERM